MRKPARILVVLALSAVAVAGCNPFASDRDEAAELSEQRLMLSEGYSLLYGDAVKIDRVQLVLYLKVESPEFNALITRISDYGEALKADLERIARDYPGVRIDLTPMPEIERRKRFAIAKDRVIRFFPLGGHSRLEYERTMLISMAAALDHESHLCRVMAEEEPDPGLAKFLRSCEKQYQDLQGSVMDLLNREHFKNNTNP
ncbi:MAG: hypothetical protein WC809_10955 [Sinimarinibacterium sp.]|jgi:hypothetical protein